MGRWAQRQRTGGGINQPIQMIAAVGFSGTVIDIEYSAPISVLALTAADFESNPSGEAGIVRAQISPTKARVTFSGPIGSDTDVTYTGSVANVVSPQTIAIS
jgi:hypothetical protein